jgi:RND family efflux transporter MFP subunit
MRTMKTKLWISLVLTTLSCVGAVRAATPLQATGLVLPYRQVELASASEGVIVEIPVEEGAAVSAGQVLARLDAGRERTEVDYFRDLTAKRSNDLASAETLFNEKILSRTQWEEHRLEARLAETQYRNALQHIEDKSIKAPFAGLIVRLYKERGESIRTLERFAQVINLDKVYVVVYFDAAQIAQVRCGQTAQVSFPGIAAPRPGVVAIADPVVDPASSLFRVKVLVENPDHQIRTGVKAAVELTPVAVAPASAAAAR